MPSDSNGNYSLPAGYLAVTGQTILPSEHNPPLEDVAAGLTARLMRSGAGPMTGLLKLIDGTAPAPAIGFNSAQTTGFYKTASGGIGFAIGGTLTGEVGASGFILKQGQVSYQYLQSPVAAARLLGSNAGGALTITAAADNGAGLIRLVMADTSTLTTGQSKTVKGVTGTTEANNTWTITVIDSTHVDLQASTFTNAYVSGGTIGGTVEDISLGTGLVMSGNVLAAPATPVPGGFKKLSIKVATNTTVSVAADFVTTTDGTNFQSTAVSSTVNLGTTGADALDAGTIAIDTWYYIWVIAKADGTTKCVASTSATAPTMPSGYTYKARMGAVRTIHATATLYGTWQLGRRAQYVLGLAQTTVFPTIASGTGGTLNGSSFVGVSTSVAALVPPTASFIRALVTTGSQAQAVALAPNNNFGGYTSQGPPPLVSNGSGTGDTVRFGEFMLESGNVFYAATGTLGLAQVAGWEDNI